MNDRVGVSVGGGLLVAALFPPLRACLLKRLVEEQ